MKIIILFIMSANQFLLFSELTDSSIHNLYAEYSRMLRDFGFTDIIPLFGWNAVCGWNSDEPIGIQYSIPEGITECLCSTGLSHHCLIHDHGIIRPSMMNRETLVMNREPSLNKHRSLIYTEAGGAPLPDNTGIWTGLHNFHTSGIQSPLGINRIPSLHASREAKPAKIPRTDYPRSEKPSRRITHQSHRRKLHQPNIIRSIKRNVPMIRL